MKQWKKKISLTDLPEEVLTHILSYLNRRELALVGNVNSLFYRLSRDKLLKENAPHPDLNYKEYCGIKITKKAADSRIECITQLSEELFVTGSKTGVISIWRISDFVNINNFTMNKGSITFIEVLEKDKIICGAWDNVLFIIDLKTNSMEEIETDTHIPRYGIALSKDSIITKSSSIYLSKNGLNDDTLRVWYLCTKKYKILNCAEHIFYFKKLTQNELMIGTRNGTISIMNIEDEKCINYVTIKNHSIIDILANGDILTRSSLGLQNKLVLWQKKGAELIQKVEWDNDFAKIAMLKKGIFLLQHGWDTHFRKNRFLILEKETFQQLNSIYIPGIPTASCILSNGQFIIGTSDGNLQFHRFAIALNKKNEMDQVKIDNEKSERSHSRKCSIQ